VECRTSPPGDLAFLKSLIESGTLRTVIDRRYSLDDSAEAFLYAEAGHKEGHVAINIAPWLCNSCVDGAGAADPLRASASLMNQRLPNLCLKL